MHIQEAINLNILAQWVAIIVGVIVAWATLRRMRLVDRQKAEETRTNDLHHLEERLKEDIKIIREDVRSIWRAIADVRGHVSDLEGWRRAQRGGSPGGK